MRVVNLSDYNKYLKERGKIFCFINRTLSVQIGNRDKKLKRGEVKYPDIYIKSIYAIGYIIKLPLRQLSGFLEDYAKNRGISVDVPDYSTLSKRLKNMNIQILNKRQKCLKDSSVDIAIDSSIITIYNNTPQHAKTNGKTRKLSGWQQVKKMHLALDTFSKTAKSMLYTHGTLIDHQAFSVLISDINSRCNINTVRADRAYDKEPCYRDYYNHEIKPIIPPVTRAKLKKGDVFENRNNAVMYIKNYGDYDTGLLHWKRKHKYGKCYCQLNYL